MRVLSTKLYAPALRPDAVARPRLVARLRVGRRARLVLLSAPAGFGKTTLLGEWLAAEQLPAAWLSLDPADNDPARFFGYLYAALAAVEPESLAGLRPLLASVQGVPGEAMLTALVNALCDRPSEMALVLDDYHLVDAAPVHAAVAFLCENLPPQVRLVVATRADPPLPLARLRSRGQLLELRADALRFTAEEARDFLNLAMGLDLSGEEVAALEARTEGWVAGLQLAALSLQGRADVAGFIRSFAGTNRFILDFLVEEVLNREPEEVQTFLLRTSLLARLSGGLCEAVTGLRDSQAMLERLERANLFLVPLDDERRWYRYHHLFADLLAARLHAVAAESVPELHQRASRWHDANGYPDEAVRHALAARDYRRAGALVVKYWLPVGHSGQTSTVLRWLESFPDEAVAGEPMLSVAYAWLLWLTGNIAEVDRRLDDATRALAGRRVSEGDRQAEMVAAGISALRAHVARHRAQIPAAIDFANQALAQLSSFSALASSERALFQAHALSGLGHAYRESGATELSVETLRQVMSLAKAGGNILSVTICAFYIARQQQALGRLREAEESCRAALLAARAEGYEALPVAGMLHLALAEVLRERDELAEAERQLEAGRQFVRQGGYSEGLRNLGVVAARLCQSRGDLPGAAAALAEAEALVARARSPLGIAEVAAHQARLNVARGDLAAAEGWWEEARRRPGEDRGYTREAENLSRARLLLARGDLVAARRHLDETLALAEEGARLGTVLELLMLRALVAERQGQGEAALADLGCALDLAAPQGYTRVFLDEGEALAALLRRGVERGLWRSSIQEYASSLLARLGLPAPPQRPPLPATGLVEPLSEREREVLRLVGAGLSNQEIAERAVISLNTVKKHTSNIFAKLGVASRTQAIARAREIGLL
ncbi:MAG: LuxR C-terminal-related transcriptional regulator [Chloroflexota bacterium]